MESTYRFEGPMAEVGAFIRAVYLSRLAQHGTLFFSYTVVRRDLFVSGQLSLRGAPEAVNVQFQEELTKLARYRNVSFQALNAVHRPTLEAAATLARSDPQAFDLQPVTLLGLSPALSTKLQREGITTAGHLRRYPLPGFARFRQFGPKSLKMVETCLQACGYAVAPDWTRELPVPVPPRGTGNPLDWEVVALSAFNFSQAVQAELCYHDLIAVIDLRRLPRSLTLGDEHVHPEVNRAIRHVLAVSGLTLPASE